MDENRNRYKIKIKKLILDDFRAFGHFEMDFDEKLTVIIGNNGAGKSTLLDATAALLSLFLQHTFYPKDDFSLNLSRKNVKNGVATCSCHLVFDIEYLKTVELTEEEIKEEDDDDDKREWVEEHKIGFSINRKSGQIEYLDLGTVRLDDFNDMVETYREGDSLPVLVYYGCNMLDIELPKQSDREQYISEQQKIYEYALTPERFNFKQFYEWFDKQTKINMQDFDKWFKERHKQLKPFEPNYKLEIVKKAVLDILNETEIPNYTNLIMDYQENGSAIVVDKTKGNNSSRVELNQMSAGEKAFISIVADLALRLLNANPKSENDALDGHGVVLIDEIDLHLHPKWQRQVLPKLRQIFPNIQFIMTTHSPSVIQSIDWQHRFILNDSNQIVKIEREPGLSITAIMGDYFDIGVDKMFDDDTESLLTKFQEFKEEILSGTRNINDDRFIQLLQLITSKSQEVKEIVARDLRYIKAKIRK